MGLRVLLIEDDPTTQTLIRLGLKEYDFDIADSIEKAEALFEKNKSQYAAFIIDLGLPDGNGFVFLERILAKNFHQPTVCIILTSDEQIVNKIKAFDLGADDYVLKPFDALELKARLDLRIKNNKKHHINREITVGDVILNQDEKTVNIISENGKISPIDLTSIEFQLLSLFIQNVGKVYTRDDILEKVWKNSHVLDRTVDSHIANLRKKISHSKAKIQSKKGLGYYLHSES